jgi:hypothetical protein
VKALGKIALLAAGAATLAVSVPAQARHNDWGGNGWRGDRIDAGDIIAGALIIGGIAAVASSIGNNNDGYRGGGYRDRYRDRDYGYDNGGNGYYNNGYDSRQAVDQCVRAAKRAAGNGWARVTDVTSIERVRGGYEVRGRLVVEDRGGYRRSDWRDHDWRGDDDRYGYRYDRYDEGYDKGRFSCTTRYGQVEDVNLSGLRRRSNYSY